MGHVDGQIVGLRLSTSREKQLLGIVHPTLLILRHVVKSMRARHQGGRFCNSRKRLDQPAWAASSLSTSPLWQCRYLRPFRHGQGLLGPWFCFL